MFIFMLCVSRYVCLYSCYMYVCTYIDIFYICINGICMYVTHIVWEKIHRFLFLKSNTKISLIIIRFLFSVCIDLLLLYIFTNSTNICNFYIFPTYIHTLFGITCQTIHMHVCMCMCRFCEIRKHFIQIITCFMWL